MTHGLSAETHVFFQIPSPFLKSSPNLSDIAWNRELLCLELYTSRYRTCYGLAPIRECPCRANNEVELPIGQELDTDVIIRVVGSDSRKDAFFIIVSS